MGWAFPGGGGFTSFSGSLFFPVLRSWNAANHGKGSGPEEGKSSFRRGARSRRPFSHSRNLNEISPRQTFSRRQASPKPGAGRPYSLAVTRASATSWRQRNAGRVVWNSSLTVR